MSYIAQLLDQRRQPDLLGGLMMGAGGLAGGLAQFQAQEQERKRLEEERKRKASQDSFPVLQKAGEGLMLAGRNQEAADIMKATREAFNTGYGQNLPIPSIVGEPVMARGQEFIEHQGPPTTPGGKVGVTAPTPYTYDTGARNFNNPRTAAGVRAGLMLGAPKLEEVSAGASLFDPATGKAVFTAPYELRPNQIPADTAIALKREGWDKAMDRTRYLTGAAGERQQAALGAQSGFLDRRLAAQAGMQADRLDSQAFLQGERLGSQEYLQGERLAQQAELQDKRITAADKRQDKAIAAKPIPENKEFAKRREAAAIASRVLGKSFPWIGTPMVVPGTSDIAITVPKSISPSQVRQLENAAIDLGGFLFETPGQRPRIIMNPGSTAAALKNKLNDPKMAWARDARGVETRVEDKPGVKREAPPPTSRMPNFTKDALDVFNNRYPHGYPGKDAEKRAELELIEETLVAKWKARSGQASPAPSASPEAGSGITANDLLRAAEQLQKERERQRRLSGGK